MIHDIYGRPSSSPDLLDYSKVYLSAHQNYSTPFYYKKEVAIKSFNAQIVAVFLFLIAPDIKDNGREAINKWLISADIRRTNQLHLAEVKFLNLLESV